MKKDNLYYTIRNIDDYNKSFNFIISPRKTGKAIHFERVRDKDRNDTYKNIKEEIIKIEENN